jgi:hypothetical protein
MVRGDYGRAKSRDSCSLSRRGLDACLGGAALALVVFRTSGVLPILPLFFRFVVLA